MSEPFRPMSIHSLPNELIDHILSFLLVDPPSSNNLRQIPNHTISSSSSADLKNVSRTSRLFRELSRVYLFSHCRYELRDQDRYLAFIEQHDLESHVESVVISVRSIFPGSEKRMWWKDLFEHLDPEVVTVVAPPYMFSDMAHCALENTHSWAFDIPLQTMQFHQQHRSKRALVSKLDKPEGDDSFFSFRPWTEILFNEGSSLKAYSNYEYYLLRVPSLMNHWGSVDPLQTTILPYPVTAISRLTSFHYTAVFPFYNHTNLVLKVIRNMSNLRRLTFQLAPLPDSDIFEKELQTGTLDANDPWMELDTSYSLISHSVRYLGVQGKLVEFQTFDYKLAAHGHRLFHTLFQVLRSKWNHEGNGLWAKKDEPLVSSDSSGPD